jgi:hypothetical protein
MPTPAVTVMLLVAYKRIRAFNPRKARIVKTETIKVVVEQKEYHRLDPKLQRLSVELYETKAAYGNRSDVECLAKVKRYAPSLDYWASTGLGYRMRFSYEKKVFTLRMSILCPSSKQEVDTRVFNESETLEMLKKNDPIHSLIQSFPKCQSITFENSLYRTAIEINDKEVFVLPRFEHEDMQTYKPIEFIIQEFQQLSGQNLISLSTILNNFKCREAFIPSFNDFKKRSMFLLNSTKPEFQSTRKSAARKLLSILKCLQCFLFEDTKCSLMYKSSFPNDASLDMLIEDQFIKLESIIKGENYRFDSEDDSKYKVIIEYAFRLVNKYHQWFHGELTKKLYDHPQRYYELFQQFTFLNEPVWRCVNTFAKKILPRLLRNADNVRPLELMPFSMKKSGQANKQYEKSTELRQFSNRYYQDPILFQQITHMINETFSYHQEFQIYCWDSSHLLIKSRFFSVNNFSFLIDLMQTRKQQNIENSPKMRKFETVFPIGDKDDTDFREMVLDSKFGIGLLYDLPYNHSPKYLLYFLRLTQDVSESTWGVADFNQIFASQTPLKLMNTDHYLARKVSINFAFCDCKTLNLHLVCLKMLKDQIIVQASLIVPWSDNNLIGGEKTVIHEWRRIQGSLLSFYYEMKSSSLMVHALWKKRYVRLTKHSVGGFMGNQSSLDPSANKCLHVLPSVVLASDSCRLDASSSELRIYKLTVKW